MRTLLLPCLALGTLGLAGEAEAGLEVCNQTDTRHQVAIGYSDEGTWVSEGWWGVDPGACTTVIGGDLKVRNLYYRPTASGHDYGGEYAFCVDSAAFTIRGDTDCAARGYREALFLLEDTGPTATEWTIVLNGAPVPEKAPAPPPAPAPAPPPPAPAPMAGLGFEYSDFDSGIEPGTMGEPFTVEGRFLECAMPEGERYCLFEAEGWEWYLYEGATPSFALDAMEVLTPGQRAVFSGDVISYGDISVEAMLRRYVADGTEDESDRIWAAVQGSFFAADEPGYTADVYTNNFFTENGGILTGEIFRIAPDCPESNGAGPVMIRAERETQDSVCFVLSDWGPGGFTTTFAGGWQETRWVRR